MCYDCLDDAIHDEDALREAREELERGPQEEAPRSYIYACKLADIPQNGSRGRVLVLEHTEIALFYLKNRVFAISNICPHQQSPLLSEGYIDKQAMTVACPLHGWTYSIETGRSVMGSGNVPTYEVRLIDDEVWVEEPIVEQERYEIDFGEEPPVD